MLLGIIRPAADVIIFPNQGIEKAHISELFKQEGNMWFKKLPTAEYCMLARVLNIILVHNLLQTSHKTNMSDDMVHLVASLMEGKVIDVSAIMCQMMLQTFIDDGIKRGLPYGVLVIQIIEKCSVTFSRDVITLSYGFPIDDATIKRMKG